MCKSSANYCFPSIPGFVTNFTASEGAAALQGGFVTLNRMIVEFFLSLSSCLPRTMGVLCEVTCALFSCSHGGTCIVEDGHFACR